MSRVNLEFNTEEGFERLKSNSELRSLPTPNQLDAVINLARRTHGLEDVWDELVRQKRFVEGHGGIYELPPD